MLTIEGRQSGSYCDKVGRRGFLKIGALGMGFGGMTMADMMRLQAAEGKGSSTKSIINVHLQGGPSHQDMWDLKPDAPTEYRGEFNPIKTNAPGLEICEHFPQLATMGDKFAVIRGLVGSVSEHSDSTSQTGYRKSEMKEIGGPPSIGAVISHLQGFNGGLAPWVANGAGAGPGYLGAKYKSFSTGSARSLLELTRITADRLNGRAYLLQRIDKLRRDVDASGQLEAADAFTQQAVDVVLSGKMAAALDVSKEDPATRARYVGDNKGSMRNNERFLLARRLVEAGVRCVSMSWGSWDLHGNNFIRLKTQLPALDNGLANLIRDLEERGMLNDVTIAVWGEFGRTPRINNNYGGPGRDHWPRVAAAFLAGGGIRGGQAVGESDRIASDAANHAVHIHEVLATMYHNVGINPRTTQIIDPSGRPRFLLDKRTPIRELV